MIKSAILSAIACTMFVSAESYAAQYMKAGLVAGIYIEDQASGGTTAFTIAGFTAADAGNQCSTNDGMVIVRIRNDEAGKRQFAIVLAAHMAKKSIRVRIDTVKSDGSSCYLWMLERMDY